MPEYVFDNKGIETEQRFGALETLFDPVSKRCLEPYVVDGAHCLEVGGGSGSIALWMSERVGANGRVLITDINTRFLDGIAAANIEVRVHDITSDELEQAAFDVAHTRLVLLHLPERKRAIERIIAAVKPGGWLVLQEFDAPAVLADPQLVPGEHLFKTLLVLWETMAARGVDNRFGRKLAGVLHEFGMDEIAAEGHIIINRGGSPWSRLLRANFDQLHDAIIESGKLTQAEFDADVARLDDPSITWPSPVLWTVRARKP